MFCTQNIPLSTRQKVEATQEATTQPDGNTSNQPKSDQEFFEEVNRKFEEQMIPEPQAAGSDGQAATEHTGKQQKDPTEADDEGNNLL